MSMRGAYPHKFLLKDIVEDNISSDTDLWMSSRGFCPPNPQTYESNLVISLYNEDGYEVSKQLRDVYDTNVDTKYTLTRNVYDPLVRTTETLISGRLVICEGTLDSLLLRLHGINAYTTLGLKTYRLKQLFESLSEPSIIIFDRDDPGRYASKKYGSRGLLYPTYAPYKDVCEMYQKDKEVFDRWLGKLRQLTLI